MIASMAALFGHKGKVSGAASHHSDGKEKQQRDVLKILLASPVAIRDGDELMKMND